MTELLLIVGGFLLGSIPFSVIFGSIGLKTDIRGYGDHNPGATNVFRAGGKFWGVLAVIADIGKGALPVGLAAHVFRIDDVPMLIVSLAPVVGHAFSPWLGFKGGKAIATSFGIYIGLTIFEGMIVGLVMFVYWYLALRPPGYIIAASGLSLTLYFLFRGAGWLIFAVIVLDFGLMLYKHREDLRQPIKLKISPIFKPFFKSLNTGPAK